MPVQSKPLCPWSVPCVLWGLMTSYTKLFNLTSFIHAEVFHSAVFENTREKFEQLFCRVSIYCLCLFSYFLLRSQASRDDFFLLLNSSSTSYSFLPVDLIIPFKILRLEVVEMQQTGRDGSAKFTQIFLRLTVVRVLISVWHKDVGKELCLDPDLNSS